MMNVRIDPRTQAIKAGLVNELVLGSLIIEAADAMREAGRTIVMPNRHCVIADSKIEFGLREPVTAIDKRVSDFLLGKVRDRLPGSYSEEDLPRDPNLRRTESLLWQFDPLDGTQEYIDGYFEGVSIQAALLARLDECYMPIAGIIYRPASDSLWFTDERGRVKWERAGKPYPLPTLKRDSVLTASLRKVEPDPAQEQFFRTLASILGERVEVLESGGAGAWFSDLLESRSDLIMANQDRSKAWDVAMGIALVRARGGFVCDYKGREFGDLNGIDLRNREGFIASIVYAKEDILPHIPEGLLHRSA